MKRINFDLRVMVLLHRQMMSIPTKFFSFCNNLKSGRHMRCYPYIQAPIILSISLFVNNWRLLGRSRDMSLGVKLHKAIWIDQHRIILILRSVGLRSRSQ